MSLDAQIEAVLFWKAEPMSIKKLANTFGKNETEIREAVGILKKNLLGTDGGTSSGRGLTLIELDDSVSLGTAREMSPLIEKLTKEELVRDLGKAGLETISIVLYQGPITRAEIDYIRGVNSQFILRNLLIRGLVEKVENPADRRSFLYKPTMDLLAHLGVSAITDLPDYENVRKNIAAFKAAAAEEAGQAEKESDGETIVDLKVEETAGQTEEETAIEQSEESQN
jgi:segregation and condensation protein B